MHQAPLMIETSTTPTHAVIWLHGLGADGYDFESIVPMLNLPKLLGIRFIFPHAPIRPITLNGGLPMRGWFDIPSLDLTHEQDEKGIRESSYMVEQLIAAQKTQGIAAKNIFLAGFSQGGAIALHAGLRYPERLAGILGLSTLLVLPQKLPAEASSANHNIPIFLAHGTQDPIIPLSIGELAKNHLQQLGYAINWHTYPMPHSVCNTEVADINKWLLTFF